MSPKKFEIYFDQLTPRSFFHILVCHLIRTFNGRARTGLKCYKILAIRPKNSYSYKHLHDTKKETHNYICHTHRYNIRKRESCKKKKLPQDSNILTK